MTSKAKKAAAAGGKGKKAAGFGKGERAPAGGPSAAPLATFEDDDMYQEPIKKVRTAAGVACTSMIGRFHLCGSLLLSYVYIRTFG